jgi:hypothetical protein
MTLIRPLVVAMLALALSTAASAQPLLDRATPRVVPISPEAVASLPQDQWRPLPRREFDEFLKQLTLPPDAVSPPAAYLRQAVYEATLSGERLDGSVVLDVGTNAVDEAWLSLGSPSLYVAGLRWPGRDAVWGAADDGRTLVLVQGRDRRLSGAWALRGERTFDRLRFDVQLPPRR